MWVDSHCHLNLIEQPVEALVAQALEAGVGFLLTVNTALADFPLLLDYACRFNTVACSVGVHPNEVGAESGALYEALLERGRHERVLALGETGLDYYRQDTQASAQQEHFAVHIAAANTLGKPLIVHTRAARADTLALLRSEQAKAGVLHCFTEDWEMARAGLDLGFYISFSGIVTFKNTHALKEVARKVPADRLLVETDAPYLAPVPVRGERCVPAYVVHTGHYLAKLRGVDPLSLAEQTTQNFSKLFSCSL